MRNLMLALGVLATLLVGGVIVLTVYIWAIGWEQVWWTNETVREVLVR